MNWRYGFFSKDGSYLFRKTPSKLLTYTYDLVIEREDNDFFVIKNNFPYPVFRAGYHSSILGDVLYKFMKDYGNDRPYQDDSL